MGLVHPSRIKRNSDGRAGDRLVLGKPLGVGILSAALKKEHLSDKGYAQMIACTTQLNTPGPALAALAGVHAITDVTGFGLAGHVLEMARGSNATAVLEMGRIPLVDGVRDLASSGFVTGASGRNWAAYGEEVAMGQDLSAVDQDLLSDPQTSGGLLVACAPDSVDAVLEIFRQQGFAHAAEIGALVPAHREGLRLQVS